MTTIIKLDPTGAEKIRYEGTILEQNNQSIVIAASWIYPDRDLGYTRFETGDRFIEYYYSERWFNIFAIASKDGQHKGWYCNITEPAQMSAGIIKQIDLYLDIWVNPAGAILLLDEDEFEHATDLSALQRTGARQGLQELQHLIAARQEMFSNIEQINTPPIDISAH